MDLTFSIGLLGLATLAVGALIVGVSVLLISQEADMLEAFVTAVGAFIGGFVASEFMVGWRNWEPVLDGLAIGPAVIGGVVVGAVVGVIAHWALVGRHRRTAEV
jgi:hypothetical protein